MSEWTSVKDKDNYPGFGQVCDIKGRYFGLNCNSVAVAYICSEYSNLMWHDEAEEEISFEVTHWKPHNNLIEVK